MGLVLWACRVVLLKSLVAFGRSSYAEKYRITKRPLITDKQIERESVWPLGYFLDFLAVVLIFACGRFQNVEIIGNDFWYSALWHIMVHATVVEFVYYWFHRFLHIQVVYKYWHQYHHKSINTEPTTGVSFEIGERLSYTVLFAISPIICDFYGHSSLLLFFLYYIAFDLLNEGGHINFDVMPAWFYNTPLKYIIYSPVFHAVHHTRFKRNYSLFMPWSDILFGSAVYSSGSQEEALLPTSNQDA
jgi:sterol desaturase/sphingolipid hydroxylase (fatty acid hydroxylase superfamily)